jgi:4-hydroxy-2-oxoheptanedioate aldolase
MIRTAADAERCVEYMTYPPGGTRGWGPFAAHARHGTPIGSYATDVAPHLTCAVLIETAEAVDGIDAILGVPGIDIAIVARFDLSTALGVPGDFEAPAMTEAVATVERAAQAAEIPLGGIALTADQAGDLAGKGYRLLINGIDSLMLEGGAAAAKSWAG